MDGDNLSQALMIGVTTIISIITISAIVIFFNSSLNIVRNVGGGKDFDTVYRSDIESTLLMSNTGNYIKGNSVINLLSYYEQDTNVNIIISNIKYIDDNGNIQILDNVALDTDDYNSRKSVYNKAARYIMDNQNFSISVEEIDNSIGSKNITIRGV